MSVYTVEVRYICEVEAGMTQDVGYNDVDEVIDKSWEKIFKNFPIFDESYREVLCKKILNHYYTREIGAETAALWKFWLNQKMNEIMPYYNKLYMSEQLKYDPLHEIDFTREITETTSGKSDGKNNSTNKENSTNTSSSTSDSSFTAKNNDTSKTDSTRTITGETENKTVNTGSTTVNTSTNGQNLHSDTPQGTIDNVADGSYLTDAQMNSSTTNSTTTVDTTTNNDGRSVEQNVLEESGNQTHNKSELTTSNNKNSDILENLNTSESGFSKNDTGIREYLEHIAGKNSSTSYAKLIQDYRDGLLNIDMDIIFELKDLFMNIY